MKLMLDTQVVLWWLQDDKRLGKQARDRLQDQNNLLFVSSISILEVAIKKRANKIKVDPTVLTQHLVKEQVIEMTYDNAAAALFAEIPVQTWKDPFDLALAAQSVSAGCIFVSADRNINRMSWDKIKVLDARK